MSLEPSIVKLAEELVSYMQEKYGFDRVPSISYIDDHDNSANPLCMTGGYDQEGETITIYITGRHPKDILRSLAHEMLHHVQKCEGMMDGHDMSATTDPNYIMHDKFLKGVEADAFKRGNITFREWEATKKGDKKMNEEKMAKSTLKKAHKAAKSALKHGGFEGYDDPESVAYATMTSKAKKGELEETAKPDYLDLDGDGDKEEPMKKAAKEKDKKKELKESNENEVQVNDALKNSHNYNTITRAMPNVAKARDEFVYEELLKKFKIKK